MGGFSLTLMPQQTSELGEPGDREVRLANNEALFRVANERTTAWEERHDHGQPESYLCECADSSCRARVGLTRPEYEAVRSDSSQFLVADGHAVLDVETVVAHYDRYDVVLKDPEVAAVVEDSDPRRH